MLRIGEFSRITGLTIKALHYYQKEGLLVPEFTDSENGYRYYSPKQIDSGLTIALLRDLDLPVGLIRSILAESNVPVEQRIKSALKQYHATLLKRIENDRERERRIVSLLTETLPASGSRSATAMEDIEEVLLPDIHVLSLRFNGAYSEVGLYFKRLYRTAGMAASGPPFCLYHEMHYSERADIEACLPVRSPLRRNGLSSHIISGVKTISTVHRGPYNTIGQTYARLFEHANGRPPLREVYEKGPGIFFRGNPDNYRTRIHLPVD